MTTYALEGTGASIAFGSSTFLNDLISLTLPERVRAVLETTHLGTLVAKTSKPAKLKDVGEISAEFDHNPAEADLLNNAIETVTIRYPLLSGQTTAAQISFSGYCTKQGGQEFAVDKLIRTKATFKVSGDLTFTAAT